MAWQASSEYVVELLEAKQLSGSRFDFLGYGTDTRKNLAGRLFIALSGDQFDAHDFVLTAAENSAAGALISKELSSSDREKLEEEYPDFILIQVDDTLEALQKLANAWRKDCGFTVIGITGSNGKTTTKEFLRSILSTKYKTYCSEGSLNNHWGVPFTLLDAGAEVEFVIAEMGMNSPGEIHRLCEVAEPDMVGVTFVGRGHLEGMGSIEAIAKEKATIYDYSASTKKIFNLDNVHTKKMFHDFHNREDLSFSIDSEASVNMKVEKADLKGMEVSGKILAHEFSSRIQVFGKHNITNLMAASTFALLCGMKPEEIVKSFENLKMAWGRNQVMEIGDNLVVFDGYNANPDSMEAFLNNAAELDLEGTKHFLLGDMLELGDMAPEFHKKIGELCAEKGFKYTHFFGSNFEQFQRGFEGLYDKESSVISATYEVSLAKKIKNMLEPRDAIFIKASRGVRLERFMDLLRENN